MENGHDSYTHQEKNSLAPKLFIIGVIAVMLGVFITIATTGFNFLKPLLTQPGPTNTMIEPTIVVSNNLKQPGILGEIKSVEIDSSNFKFVPNEIIVNQGDTVQITIKNSGGLHNFVMEGYKIQTRSIPSGESEEITLVADKKGVFEFYCSIGNHKTMGMTGSLIVK